MKRYKTQKRGFSLVELGVVGGIVAILTSVALPSMQQYMKRAYGAEQTIVRQRALIAAKERLERAMPVAGVSSGWSAPVATVGKMENFDNAGAGWLDLNIAFDGRFRGRYAVTVIPPVGATPAKMTLAAVHDLDHDGANCMWTEQFVMLSDVWNQDTTILTSCPDTDDFILY